MNTYQKFLFLLSSSERKEAAVVLGMILIMALLDVMGVASILPFMAVLTNPNIIETNTILSKAYEILNKFGVKNTQQFLFVMGVFVLILLISSLIFKAITIYLQVRFVQMREYSISKRLVEGYLHQPYSWFLNRNSSDLGKNILSEVGHITSAGINPFMELIAKSIVAISIMMLLIVVNPKIALVVGFFLGGAYGVIFYFIKTYLKKIGKARAKNNLLRFNFVNEAFGAIKQIKLSGLEKIFIKRFSISAKIFSGTSASSIVLRQLPRYILEAIAFGIIMLAILYMIKKTGSFNNALPIISLYVFAGYRLLPALQQIYGSFAQLAFIKSSLNNLMDDLKNLKKYNNDQIQDTLELNKEIVLKDIFYNYPNSSKTTLKKMNLSISAKTTVGIVGTTGSGKTTTIDIILGLLQPQKGNLVIDDQIITKQNLRAWQRNIGYVPQHIYISDNTIQANIAFGVEPENINQDSVEKVSKIANLHEFVINELKDKYQTIVGERGIRLSGGQLQRIGIARALYHNPQVLILDEATSALDNQTEKVVMDAVNNIGKQITIILIAHRLNTVKNCDLIFKLENGELIGKGTYDQLLK
ncbi:ABC transporter ATP-binding protein/permease [Candidatus Pelagibacter sp.]|nr:ABC transporter ATP-binding protein/permease [Candidatus Pelagibacter sp.]